jgi:hypothetical protein
MISPEINFEKILTIDFIYHIFATSLGGHYDQYSKRCFLPNNMEGYFNGGQGEQVILLPFLLLFSAEKIH